MKKQLILKRPDVKDFDLQPYGYIVALTNYIDQLEKQLAIPFVSDNEAFSEVAVCRIGYYKKGKCTFCGTTELCRKERCPYWQTDC